MKPSVPLAMAGRGRLVDRVLACRGRLLAGQVVSPAKQRRDQAKCATSLAYATTIPLAMLTMSLAMLTR